MNKLQLQEKILSYGTLKKNWDNNGARQITKESIETAITYLDTLIKDFGNKAVVFPMSDGGIQFEIGDDVEIEIMNKEITRYNFDIKFNTREIKLNI